jgi:hypothetical protein
MSDLLSAASLLLAVLGVLYGLWYPEIIAALDRKVPDFAEDCKGPYRHVSSVLYGRALPLTVAALGVSLIFLPDALKAVRDTILGYQVQGVACIRSYSAVYTAFCFVVAMSMAIAIHLAFFSAKLGRLCKRLKVK